MKFCKVNNCDCHEFCDSCDCKHDDEDVRVLDNEKLRIFVIKLYRYTKDLTNKINSIIGNNCVIDEELDLESDNAVKNKVIALNFSNIFEELTNIKENINSGNTGSSSIKSVFKQVYIQQNDKPEKPNGGSYDFSTNVLTPPENWSISTTDFNKQTNVWMSYRSFFNDNTVSDWSDPIVINDYKSLFDKIDEELKDAYDKILNDSNEELNNILENASQKLVEAREKLDEISNYLDNIKESWGEQGITQDEIGKIVAFADWYDKNAGVVTNIAAEIDAIKGSVTTHGEQIDTINQTVSEVKSTIDVTNSTITNQASLINANTNKVNEAITQINGMLATISSIVSSVDVNTNKVNEVKVQLDALNANLDIRVAQKIADALSTADINITPEKIIAALTNSEGGGAAIIAAINGSDSEVTISADKITLNGEVIAKLLGTERIVINNGASIFEPNGSGYVANGNIRWNEDGKISIGADCIEFDKDGNLLLTNIVAFPAGTVLISNIESNPFNEHWNNIGNINISGQQYYTYLKTEEGDDEWFINAKGVEFIVTCDDIIVPASGGTITSDDITYSAVDADGNNITEFVTKDNTSRLFTASNLGEIVKPKTLLNKWAVVFTYNEKYRKIAMINIYQQANEYINTNIALEEWNRSTPYHRSDSTQNVSPGGTVSIGEKPIFSIGNPTYDVYTSGTYSTGNIVNTYKAVEISEEGHLIYYSGGERKVVTFTGSSVTLPSDADLGSSFSTSIQSYQHDPQGNIDDKFLYISYNGGGGTVV